MPQFGNTVEPQSGGKKFAPNAVDGVNLVHSWNKVGTDLSPAAAAAADAQPLLARCSPPQMIDSGQSADEYVNGLHRYMCAAPPLLHLYVVC